MEARFPSAARRAVQAYPQLDSIQRKAVQMNPIAKKPFDTAHYLATEGPGRSILHNTPKKEFFTQGALADAVYYLQSGQAKLTVLSKRGKEATVTMLVAGDFFGEEAMVEVGTKRTSTASAVTACVALKIDREDMLAVLHDEHAFSVFFMKFILNRGIRTQADLVDQLFNSSERRLARTLLLMADFGQPGEPVRLIPHVTQETLAEMIGTTRSRVSFFMNRFRKLGYIEYNGRIHVNTSLLNMVLLDRLPEENSSRPILLDPRLRPAEIAKRAKLV
ncbi:MAG: Crp/Fnr family transcriptional regulator [Terracidiphilus sp.]|nr:Crp/Fnr family transcriptional regulator [Terracidiphilus sp.]MDR3776366.1 Crp/Fnr family transcriptional regulator [Terracidiphilus sp.]